jgi:glucose/arabinose dehydrogenase
MSPALGQRRGAAGRYLECMIRAGSCRGLAGRAGLAGLIALCAALIAPALANAAPKVGLKSLGKFDNPVFITGAPGAGNLLFVVEKEGKIRVLRDGKKLSKPFLNISDRVSANGEQGLLSMAFDPNYAESGLLYVIYTNEDCTGGGACNVEVDSFERSPDSATKALKSSREEVIEVTHHQQGNHNGGQLQFGPDDHLYVSIGDGGTQMDPENDAQNPASQLGKILRIDPTPGGGYEPAPGNPFLGGDSDDDAAFSIGLRNPFRFSFDRETGDIWIGDVGYQEWEEIDHETLANANGANFGWNTYEGPDLTPFGIDDPPLANYEPPVHAYQHDVSGEHGNVIIGGYVIRDPNLPAGLQGLYVYADNQVGGLRAYDESEDERIGLGVKVDSPASFGEDNKGRIYVASGPYRGDGRVFRLVAP